MGYTDKIKGRDGIYIKIQNNTNAVMPVSLFDIFNSNQSAAAGSMPQYTWDLTSALSDAIANGLYNIAVLAAPYNTGIYQLYTATNTGNAPFTTIQQILNVLNQMSLGNFYLVSGNTITTYSRLFIFSSINTTILLNSSHSTATFGTTFTTGGSLILDPGYSVGLIGTTKRIPLINDFWINPPGNLDGPFNRSNIFAAKSFNIDRSFFANVFVNQAKTVYIGFSVSTYNGSNASSYFKVYVNGSKIADISSAGALNAFAANVNTEIGTAFAGNQITYICWTIIPVQLVTGNNLIQFIKSADGGSGFDIAGMEIYDNTVLEIEDAISYSDLNLLFSSYNNYFNKPLF